MTTIKGSNLNNISQRRILILLNAITGGQDKQDDLARLSSTKKKEAMTMRFPLGRPQIQKLILATSLLLMASSGFTSSEEDQHQFGSKYSPLKQINTGNIANLEQAWEYRTGEVIPEDLTDLLIAFEDQPSMIEGNLVVCTTTRKIIALDPKTGKQRWKYDPKDPKVGMQKCRGIAAYVDDSSDANAQCHSRIILGTADYRLVAIDAKTGVPCADFGDNGEVKMPTSTPQIFDGEVVANSRPAIVNDVIIVGSSVADNQRVDAPSGRVMAYDARSGEFRWSFDPIPHNPDDPASSSWENGTGNGWGGGNVWATTSADQSLDLVYLPTTSASGDFYGGGRAGDNHYTTSVVAVKGATGEVVWHQQLVHHNVFDYDIPSQPLLIDYPNKDGKLIPALVQNTKMGLIFVFDRATGEPLVPIEERPVPQDGAVKGQILSKTQPFPVGMPTLAPQGFSPDDAWGFTFIDKWLCKRKVEKYRYGAIYTPPSEQGTIFSPSVGGGPNWGGGAFDPESNIMIVPSNRVPTIVTLTPREKAKIVESQAIESLGAMTFDVTGAPYIPTIEPLLSPLGAPCSEPPWAVLSAVDIVSKKILWESPLGDVGAMMGAPFSMMLGTPGAGGPLATAGGLVFIGYSLDKQFRAFDIKSGETVWSADLPFGGHAIPISYEIDGEQYIVITAGGHSMYGSQPGDAVIAYKLKK
nr:pyrroloquinoline quinone-dependent dehydrogenase [Zhongshania aquimaris]